MTTTTLLGRSPRRACCSGVHVALGCPVGYHAPDVELERLNALGPGDVRQVHTAADAVAGATAVHTDTWTSMGQEMEKEDRKQAFEGFTITAQTHGCGRT